MIDWLALFWNALWVLGLTVIVAALSYFNWVATQNGRSLRSLLEKPSFSVPFAVGACLFCLGLVGLSAAWWEQLVWGILALVSALHGYQHGKILFRGERDLDRGEIDGTS